MDKMLSWQEQLSVLNARKCILSTMHYYFKLSYKYLFLRKASIKPYTKVIPAHGCLSLSLSTRVWDWRGDTCFNASTKGVTSRTSLRICSSKLQKPGRDEERGTQATRRSSSQASSQRRNPEICSSSSITQAH